MVGEDFNYELLRADANGTEIFVEDLNMKLSVPLIGRYQGDNCAVAVAVLQKLMERGLYLPDEAIIAGLRHTKWARPSGNSRSAAADDCRLHAYSGWCRTGSRGS